MTVRLHLAKLAACPAGPGPESVTCRVVSEGVCHEASLLPSRPEPMSETADDDEDLERPRFIRMWAEDTFDGQERVFTRAAYDLQVQATAHSARCGHPGYVPDDYLEHLDGLGIETTITAVELCAIGTWERVGGYRVLDWEAVEVCLDQVRQDKGEDSRALAWEREHEARIQARMAKPMVVTPPCAACGTPAAHIELLAPSQLPAGWDQWPTATHGSFLRRPGPGQWYLLRQNIATGNSYGGPIDASLAGRIAWAFRPPLRFAQVRTARFHDDAGFCPDCEVPYCHRHWHLSDTEYGYCPYGHGKNVDQHWSPLTAGHRCTRPVITSV